MQSKTFVTSLTSAFSNLCSKQYLPQVDANPNGAAAHR